MNNNTFLNGLKEATSFTVTENGAIAHESTLNAVLDMFALCGAYRNRSDSDCIKAFTEALEENEMLAMKCLFYLRDCRGGQGERRFFRVCFRWLANHRPDVAKRNVEYISEYGRWDDLVYSCLNTKIEEEALRIIDKQFFLDLESKTPSLLGKWLPSENASSSKTKAAARRIRTQLALSAKTYRKSLSALRSRINIVERLMSENRWNEIEFDKIPSRAGLIYKNAFARRDIIAKKYEAFAKDETTKVNADLLNPIDIAEEIFTKAGHGYYRDNNTIEESMENFTETDIFMFQKYWDNLKDYYHGRKEAGIAVVDVSGSMDGTPLYAAVSMGAYIAERGHGPFANHFITFSETPDLVKFRGNNIVEKFLMAEKANWKMNTNIKAVFELLLRTAKNKNTKAEDMPERVYIFSDMEFDSCTEVKNKEGMETLLESIARKWKEEGYELPHLIFWNLDARQDNIPALNGRFSYISGFSMSVLEATLSGKDGTDLMLDILLGDRYKAIN